MKKKLQLNIVANWEMKNCKYFGLEIDNHKGKRSEM